VCGGAKGEAVSEGKLTEIRVGVSTSAPRRGNAEEILARGVEDRRAGIWWKNVARKPKPLRSAMERGTGGNEMDLAAATEVGGLGDQGRVLGGRAHWLLN
jgi:hypothetical protein